MKEKELLEICYWKIRATLTVANAMLQSPHPLWSELNELIESMDSLENCLDIPNRYIHGF